MRGTRASTSVSATSSTSSTWGSWDTSKRRATISAAWSIVVYMSVSDSRSIGPASVRGELDMTLMDLAMVWSPTAERFTGPEVFGGLRYLSIDFGLRATLDPPPTVNVGPTTATRISCWAAGTPRRSMTTGASCSAATCPRATAKEPGASRPTAFTGMDRIASTGVTGTWKPRSRTRNSEQRGHELFRSHDRLRIRLLIRRPGDSASN